MQVNVNRQLKTENKLVLTNQICLCIRAMFLLNM